MKVEGKATRMRHTTTAIAIREAKPPRAPHGRDSALTSSRSELAPATLVVFSRSNYAQYLLRCAAATLVAPARLFRCALV